MTVRPFSSPLPSATSVTLPLAPRRNSAMAMVSLAFPPLITSDLPSGVKDQLSAERTVLPGPSSNVQAMDRPLAVISVGRVTRLSLP